MRHGWIVGVFVVAGCGRGASSSSGAGSSSAGSSSGIVPIVWHAVGDDGTSLAIAADGVVTDACGEIGRFDRAGDAVRVTRGRPQTLSMKDVSIQGDRIQLGAMDPFEVRGGHVTSHGDDWGALDGYDGSSDARTSLAALLAASTVGPCHPPVSLAVAGGNHVLAVQADGTIVDGKAPVAKVDDRSVTSASGERLSRIDRDALGQDCAKTELSSGPYKDGSVAIVIGRDGVVQLFGGGPIGTLTGYKASRRARESAYALAITALATAMPGPQIGPPTPDHCPRTGAPTAFVPIAWHEVGDGGTPARIDAAGAVTDRCGEVARADRTAGTLEIRRGRRQLLDLSTAKIDGDRIQLDGIDPLEVQHGHVIVRGKDVATLDGYDGSDGPRASLAALALAHGNAHCLPPVSLALADGGHVLTIHGADSIVDGSATIAAIVDGRDLASPTGDRWGHARSPQLPNGCFTEEVSAGRYAGKTVAITLAADGAVQLVGAGPIGKVDGYRADVPRSDLAAQLLILAALSTEYQPPPGAPAPAETCP